MHEFKHPKYYKELRKRNKSDQAISLKAHDGECERAPDPGLKVSSFKHQASSVKHQALKLSNQPVQSPSDKHPSQSNKHQASSRK